MKTFWHWFSAILCGITLAFFVAFLVYLAVPRPQPYDAPFKTIAKLPYGELLSIEVDNGTLYISQSYQAVAIAYVPKGK